MAAPAAEPVFPQAEGKKPMTSSSRRRFLQTVAHSAGAAAALTAFPESIRRALAVPAASRTGTIQDIEHIVVFMQENRSFDHSWYKTHAAIDAGRYDQWCANKTDMTMGYHLRSDIPFHYALADAFTVCDAYFCSLPGPTHPNRAYLMTGMVDPTGTKGGPLLDNNDFVDGDGPPNYQLLSWTTYPERLQAAGISWQVYQQGTTGADPLTGNYGTNILQNFTNFI